MHQIEDRRPQDRLAMLIKLSKVVVRLVSQESPFVYKKLVSFSNVTLTQVYNC